MMSTTATVDELVVNNHESDNPGFQLAQLRSQKGYSVDYVASKLHLRVHIIENLESGDFSLLPQPVFVKGYLRAYAKLLGVSPEPFLMVYKKHYDNERKPERVALWQSKKESNKAEHVIRWVTIIFAIGVLVAVGLWWQKNRDNNQVIPVKEASTDLPLNQNDVAMEINLNDISKMQSMLSSNTQMSPLEKQGD